ATYDQWTRDGDTWQKVDSGIPNDIAEQRLFDMNGDGLLDIAAVNAAGQMTMYASTGTGWSTVPQPWTVLPEELKKSVIIDYNLDGRVDLIIPDRQSSDWSIFESTDHWDFRTLDSTIPKTVTVLHRLDMDGNGNDALAGIEDGRIIIYRNNVQE